MTCAEDAKPRVLMRSMLWRTSDVVQFHSSRVGLVFLSRHDHDAAVARTQVEHLLAGFKAAQLQHLIDDDLRRGIVRRKLIVFRLLPSYQNQAENGKSDKNGGTSH